MDRIRTAPTPWSIRRLRSPRRPYSTRTVCVRARSLAPRAWRAVQVRVGLALQRGHQTKISGCPRFRYKVEKRWSTQIRWSIRGGKKVARRGHRWSQTGTAVSNGHPGNPIPKSHHTSLLFKILGLFLHSKTPHFLPTVILGASNIKSCCAGLPASNCISMRW